MKKFKDWKSYYAFILLLCGFLIITGCSGGDGGGGTWKKPEPIDAVSSTKPVDGETGVPVGNKLTVTFSEEMDPATINTTTFTLKEGTTAVSGTVAYSGVTAVFTPTSDLKASTKYTATITTGAKNLAGNPLANDYVWSFTTGATKDTTAPLVSSTDPSNLETGIALNRSVAATFDEEMDPLTITTTTFTLDQGGVAVAGAVSYAGLVATFNPTSDLTALTTYTATITTGAKDLGGNALAANKVWTFTTGTTADTTAPTVTSTDPVDTAAGVIVSKNVKATFSEAMDPLTITKATFTLDQGGVAVAGAVSYAGLVATFNPTSDLTAGTTYTATITTGAKDLAGNALAAKKVWTFTTVAALPLGPAAVDLGTAADFAILAKSGITTTGVTLITGDIGVSPIDSTAMTGFGEAMDASGQFSTSPLVVGKLYASDYGVPTPAKMTAAISDLHTAYLDAAGRTTPDGVDLYAGLLETRTFPPGLYKYNTGISIAAAGTVTLNGGPNDVWIFQIAGDITVNPGAGVALTGGAVAENVFWQAGGLTGVTFDTTSTFKGIIMAAKGIEFRNGATLVNGRALAETNVTLIGNTITEP
ncbi:MAG: Ig-like domain-containing protein [Deltaproteobacteria bacterium]|nr:Ig-like domain-containing protein [Deltaproteobacteria bacterium]